MRHAFMNDIAEALAGQGIATLRYQFPYVETGGGRPDSPAVAEATVRAAVAAARSAAPDLPLVAGGKSFGGRMTSNAEPTVRSTAFAGSSSSAFRSTRPSVPA